MNRRRVFLLLGIGIGGLGLAAHQLLSFQVQTAAIKGMARALVTRASVEMGIGAEVARKATGLIDQGIDGAAPHLTRIREVLGQVEKAQASGGGEAAVKGHLDELSRELVALIDLKDRMTGEARRTFTPRERAQTIVKVARAVRERTGLEPEAIEGLLGALRTVRRTRLRAVLKADERRMASIEAVMDEAAQSRKAMRKERRQVLAQLESAVDAGATDQVFEQKLARWDQLAARGSDGARQALERWQKTLTVGERAAVAVHAKKRIDRVLLFLALVGKFRPVG